MSNKLNLRQVCFVDLHIHFILYLYTYMKRSVRVIFFVKLIISSIVKIAKNKKKIQQKRKRNSKREAEEVGVEKKKG